MFKPRPIMTDPNPVLRQKAQLVSLPLSSEDEDWLRYMIDHVRVSQNEEENKTFNLESAVGIAAPQLGQLKQMFYMNVTIEKDKTIEYAFVNPRILGHSLQKAYLASGEGCLSVPTKHEGYVPRYHQIIITGYDYLTKKQVQVRLAGYAAIVAQHEMDHLNGILYYDHINQTDPFKEIAGAREI